MKIFAIKDKESEKRIPLGWLFCYEKAEAYIIELREDLDEWEAPLLFQELVKRRQFTIPKRESFLWVKERVLPSSRQNLGAILKQAKLKEYGELPLLVLTKGRCTQDACYLEKTDWQGVAESVRRRLKRNITEVFCSGEGHIVCMFRDNAVKKIDVKKLAEHCEGAAHVLRHEELFSSVHVDVGGYGILFGDNVEIPVSSLWDAPSEEICVEDFYCFAKNNLVDTTAACEMLECSRQNLAYLNMVNRLLPIANSAKEKIYTRGAVTSVGND